MVPTQKMAKLLLQTINDLQIALKTKIEGDTKALSKKIWEVGANLEYLLFIINISRSQKNSSEEWKKNEKIARTFNMDYELSIVQALLGEASSIILVDLEEGYRKVWFAQGHLLRVQKALERTKTT